MTSSTLFCFAYSSALKQANCEFGIPKWVVGNGVLLLGHDLRVVVRPVFGDLAAVVVVVSEHARRL